MSITTVLFDLDGTLVPMDQDIFVKDYFRRIAAKLAPQGYDPKKLVDTIWRGTEAMVKNDGSRTNEEAFWDLAVSVYGDQIVRDKHFFDAFYEEEFDKVKAVCGFHPAAAEIVHGLKAKGYRVALATNPIFPARATQWRIQWAGLKPEDFELYTTYENSRHCKPNLDYYRDILKQLNVKAEECLMVGNDVAEDMVARELGMQVFLLTDCIINKTGADISAYPHGGFEELAEYLDAMPEPYIFRKAKPEEIRAVFDLIMGRVAWMDQVGIRQWNTTKYDQRYPLSYYEDRRQKEELFVLTDRAGEMLSVGALFHEDERWPEPESAYYLHHLASRVDAKGTGSIFLQMAEEYTARMGKRYMRLDSAVGNKSLESYYTSRGYVEAGTCKDGLYEGILRQKELEK